MAAAAAIGGDGQHSECRRIVHTNNQFVTARRKINGQFEPIYVGQHLALHPARRRECAGAGLSVVLRPKRAALIQELDGDGIRNIARTLGLPE